MKRRLGVWWRLGIVLTVFWMVGATAYFAITHINDQIDTVLNWQSACLTSYAESTRPTVDCGREAHRMLAEINRGMVWAMAAMMAGFCALLGWIAFGILYGSARWILAGRKPVEKPE